MLYLPTTLEHVNNPIQVLKQSKKWLNNSGFAIFTVPNASSLHRKIGVKMGILKSIYDKTYNDKLIGHQRVYDIFKLKKDIMKAGFIIKKMGGYNIKLVSQKQMKNYSPTLLKAIFEVSLESPIEICSNLFVVCKKF